MEIESVIEHNKTARENLFKNNEELNQIRHELLQSADLKHKAEEKPVIATGHQPAIYYPGLLFKNIYTADLADQTNGIALNFIVDSDNASFKVPIPYQEKEEIKKTHIEIKNPQNEIYKDFNPSEREVKKFFDSIDSKLKSLNNKRIKNAFEKYKVRFDREYATKKNFTETIRKLRNQFDSNETRNLRDIKLSQVAQSRAYYHYLLYIIKHIESFSEVYNHAVEQSSSKDYQPVKFLEINNGWQELPCWLIKNSKRHPLWIKKAKGELHFLSDEAEKKLTINTRQKTEENIINELKDSLSLYPKATTLTILLRLFFCDVFVHGTGAIEYEQVNNIVLENFFSIDPKPSFYAVTGDIWLPILPDNDVYNGLEKDYKRKKQWLKEANRDPEKFLSKETAENFKKEKKQLAQKMRQEEDPGKRKELHQRLIAKNDEMKQHLEPEIERIKGILNRYDGILSKKEVYFERKYPYFIYPESSMTIENFRNKIKIELIPKT
jgi:hypothetical protein